MAKKVFGINDEIDVKDIGYNNVYSQRKKKRKKIVIHNMDGTTEEYNTGILFTLEEIKGINGELIGRLIAKHCNTKDKVEAYTYGLAQVVMAMLEDEKIKKEMFHE